VRNVGDQPRQLTMEGGMAVSMEKAATGFGHSMSAGHDSGFGSGCCVQLSWVGHQWGAPPSHGLAMTISRWISTATLLARLDVEGGASAVAKLRQVVMRPRLGGVTWEAW
jgi:hypothetical protein